MTAAYYNGVKVERAGSTGIGPLGAFCQRVHYGSLRPLRAAQLVARVAPPTKHRVGTSSCLSKKSPFVVRPEPAPCVNWPLGSG
jgi:hypothetical protein